MCFIPTGSPSTDGRMLGKNSCQDHSFKCKNVRPEFKVIP